MKCFVAWLWKEWRDQRAVTIGILLAVPGLTALAYWAFGERIGAAVLPHVRPTFLGIAVGLVVFAVAADLFAGESRRKTIQAVRRLPGSLRSAFLAKLAYFVLLLLGVVALQGLSLAAAEHVNAARMGTMGISDHYADGATRSEYLLAELAHFPGSTFWLTGLGFGVLGLWTLLVSSWMGRSGVAGMGALVLLAALATPFVFFFREHPWFFPGPLRLAAWTAALAALVAVVATAVSFLRGQRYAGRPFRPVLLGAVVLLVAVGGTYAYAHRSLQTWLEIEPSDEGFRIYEAKMGAGRRHLFLSVYRGVLWNDGRPLTGARGRSDPWRAQRGTPMQAWVVDLASGSYRAVGGRAERYFQPVPDGHRSPLPWPLDPTEALVTYRIGDRVDQSDVITLGWWDGRTAERACILPSNVRDQASLALLRRELSRRTWNRDGQGRRTWLLGGQVEHAGQVHEPLSGVVPWVAPRLAQGAFPGGWGGYRMPDPTPGATARIGWHIIDARTGLERQVELPEGWSFWHNDVLSPRHAFVHRSIPDAKGRYERRHQLLDFADPAAPRESRNAPRVVSSVLGEDLALALRGEKADLRLHAWNPVTGEDHALRWTGRPLEGITGAAAWGRTGDGRLLLRCTAHGGTVAWVLLHPDLERLEVLRSWQPSTNRPVALMPNNALIMLEDQRRVVRYSMGGGRVVLFPRPIASNP